MPKALSSVQVYHSNRESGAEIRTENAAGTGSMVFIKRYNYCIVTKEQSSVKVHNTLKSCTA